MLLSAYATEWNLVLGQKKVDTKTNEIPTAVEVLSQIAIEGATVTADALHCQRETAKVIRERKAHYLLAVKENQHALYQALIGLFETNRNEPCSSNRLPMKCHKTLEKDHGRIEERRGFVIRAADWLPPGDPLWEQWKDLTSVMCNVPGVPAHVDASGAEEDQRLHALLHLQQRCLRRASDGLCALALEDRKQPALGDGCDLWRGRQPCP
jgi:predicted transposase YbfD/YdcC